MRRCLVLSFVMLLSALQLQSSPPAVAAVASGECSQDLVWDYSEESAVLIYKVDRGCNPRRGGRITIQGWLERCDVTGANCEIVEKERTCRRPVCRVKWEISHGAPEIGRYRAEMESRATKPRENGSGSIDWLCYTLPVDRDCVG